MIKKIFFAVILLITVTIVFLGIKNRNSDSKPVVKVAIILDDWGYNKQHLTQFFEIGRPVTLAVLPHLQFSEYVARDAKSHGYEVLLHMPMEPASNPKRPESGMISRNMAREKVRELIDKALVSVPGVHGVNNHMGSNATRDTDLMTVFLAEIKGRGLFFVDSVTTGGSVCPDICNKLGLKFTKRDVFLDVDLGKGDGTVSEKISRRIEELCNIAVRRGEAVGIGHDKTTTLSVLKDMLPRMEAKGIKFVYVSELVR